MYPNEYAAYPIEVASAPFGRPAALPNPIDLGAILPARYYLPLKIAAADGLGD